MRDGVLLGLLVGTSLAAGGAAVLNQWLERDADARMVRTRDNPRRTGDASSGSGLWACAQYGRLWDPLQRCECVGSVPHCGHRRILRIAIHSAQAPDDLEHDCGCGAGALPPLIGWAAAEGSISTLGWILFAILFLWQMPHFFAIAWTHRNDYAQGGL